MDSTYGSASVHILPPGNRTNRSGAMTTGKSDANRLLAAYRHNYGGQAVNQPAQFQPILVSNHQSHHHPPFHHHHPHQQAYIPVSQPVQSGYAYVGRFNTVNPGKMKNIQTYHSPVAPSSASPAPKQSALNALFTWKRKPKNTSPKAGTQSPASGRCMHNSSSSQQQHQSSTSIVPPSLAKLFDKPGKRPSTVKLPPNVPQQQKLCICSGLTGSTFMAPSYFDEDDLTTTITESTNPKRQSQTLGKKSKFRPMSNHPDPNQMVGAKSSANRKTTKSTSNDSLLDPVSVKKSLSNHRKNHTVNDSKLLKINSKSMELFSHNSTDSNRKSILECDVNPYELVSDSEAIPEDGVDLEKKSTGNKTLKTKKSTDNNNSKSFKSATVAIKSSRKSQHQVGNANKLNPRVYYDTIDCVDPPYHCASVNGTLPSKKSSNPYKSIFNAANSIRIAGQSVYSSMKFDGNYVDVDCDECNDLTIVEPIDLFKNRSTSKLSNIADENVKSQSLPRSKSDISLTTSPCYSCDIDETPGKVNSTKFVEPEPDYDLEEDDIDDSDEYPGYQMSKDKNRRSKIVSKSTDRIDSMLNQKESVQSSKSKSTYNIFRSYGRKSSLTSMLLRSRSNAPAPPPVPPPPSSQATPVGVPAPPPPPPDDYFNQALSSSVNSSTTSISSIVTNSSNNNPNQHFPMVISPNSISTVSLKKRNHPKQLTTANITTTTTATTDSYQNELKEKLNRGVKSILKKTNFPVNNGSAILGATTTVDQCDSTDGSPIDDSSFVDRSNNHRAIQSTCSSPKLSSSIEGRIKEFESGLVNTLPKPKKHVHFRVKRNSISNSLNRSRSTSHIITETIEEEDDEHLNYYDDVAQPQTAPALPQSLPPTITRSVDDLISGTTNIDRDHFESASNASPSVGITYRSSKPQSPSSSSLFCHSTSAIDQQLAPTPTTTTNLNAKATQQQTPKEDADDSDNRLPGTFQASAAAGDNVNVVVVNNKDNLAQQTTTTRVELKSPSHHSHNSRELLSMLYDDNSYSNNSGSSSYASSSSDSPMSRLRSSPSASRLNRNRGGGGGRPLQLSVAKCTDPDVGPPPPTSAPPPIPARRTIGCPQQSSEVEQRKTKPDKNKRSIRSYSTGSVRSLLARKLNRKIENIGNPDSSRPRLQLTNLFTKPSLDHDDDEEEEDQFISTASSSSASSSSSSLDNELGHCPGSALSKIRKNSLPTESSLSAPSSPSMASSLSKSPQMSDHADEHIYEELDTDLYCDSASAGATRSKAASRNFSDVSSTSSSSSSFFGTRISRAEILDYLLDARGRLEKRIKEVEDDTNLLAVYDEAAAADLIAGNCSSVQTESNDSGSGVISTVNPITATTTNDMDLNANDSGNSSLCLGEDYSETLACFMSAKKYKLKSKLLQQAGSGTDDSNGETTGNIVNRRNRVSNVSNASSDSSATSGVSVSNLTLEDDAEEDGIATSNSSLGSVENSTLSSNGSSTSNRRHFGSYSSTSNIERNDSGVGTEIISDSSKCPIVNKQLEQKCVDCDSQLDESIDHKLTSTTQITSNNIDVVRNRRRSTAFAYVCPRCEKRRNERKEIISEFVDTELKYGRDLKIILEEFSLPISVAGLLTQPQVDDIFLNLGELIEVNCQFAQRLQTVLDDAFEQGDEDLTTVSIGQLFHQCLLAQIAVFERYCIRQASASLLLNQLEKEKELLRVFLRVSQMENTLLRRMNLRSFLVVPVQRVTKYPLLLNRLHKVTPHHYPDHESLREAQLKLEFHLENINQKTRGSIAATTSRIWRRISNLSSASIRSRSNLGFGDSSHIDDFGYSRLKRTALELLKDWPKDEIRFVLVGKLSYIVEKAGTSSEQINQSSLSTYGSIGALNLSSSSSNGFGQSIANSSSLSSSTSKIWSKTLKFSNASAVLVTRTVPVENSEPGEFEQNFDNEQAGNNNGEQSSEPADPMIYNSYDSRRSARTRSFSKSPLRNKQQQTSNLPVREAVLLLFKEKSGRYVLCRDILNLAMCVIANATEVDSEEFFEIHELESRESLLLKAETNSEMREWLEQLRGHSKNLGNWRRRRNALPNIMVLRNVIDSGSNSSTPTPPSQPNPTSF